MTLVLALAVFAAVALASYTAAASAEARARTRASMRQLADYGGQEPVEDENRLAPLTTRAIAPVAAWTARVGRALTPAGYVDRTRHKLVLAGQAHARSVDQFLAVRLLGIALLPLWGLLSFRLPLGSTLAWATFVLLALASLVGPDARLNRAVEQRRLAMRANLPEVLDLLTVSVEAGFGLEQALDRVASDLAGPLAEEIGRLQGEMRAGAARAAALRSLTERVDLPELRSFVLAVLQADAFGVSIAPVLRAQSEEMRVRRRQFIQERAQKAPVKMLLPMVFCIFPALFVVVLGPAVIHIGASFH